MSFLRNTRVEVRCAVCHETDDGNLSNCHRCGVRLHLECFIDLASGRCPTLGCGQRPPTLGELLAEYEREHERPASGDDLDQIIESIAEEERT